MVCNGSVDVSGALSVEGKTKFDADVQFYKKIYDLAGYEIINAASGGNSLVIGYGQYEHGAKNIFRRRRYLLKNAAEWQLVYTSGIERFG